MTIRDAAVKSARVCACPGCRQSAGPGMLGVGCPRRCPATEQGPRLHPGGEPETPPLERTCEAPSSRPEICVSPGPGGCPVCPWAQSHFSPAGPSLWIPNPSLPVGATVARVEAGREQVQLRADSWERTVRLGTGTPLPTRRGGRRSLGKQL